MTTAADYTHRPNCLAEYGAWSTICLDCGSVLVPGPSPVPEVQPGRVEVMELAEDAATGSLDRFALEEEQVVSPR
ncbi:MAG: hypothetical protein M3138_02740 [Actinomycetota bacterium]|nr:hypothetical protein [Actinomycetota bacterium]